MDRFMLFGGMAYYPYGGWQDYIGSYPSLGKALEKGRSLEDEDWWHIVDIVTMKMLYGCGNSCETYNLEGEWLGDPTLSERSVGIRRGEELEYIEEQKR